ncbi:hypothetical protein [Hymenobacter cavernae]|uniref:Uncharacterized protein n=1 Tax=Hymenobacter cavernae TaxID=2044852 RepID=A0ABQ1UU42_9BACT|nr:hypothetical protein [Hymenobacter cavernae]GGF25319.1 hypothetical protein GCM10011383_41150 [Hymenobacter cavernae]
MLSDYSSKALAQLLASLPDLQGLFTEREDYFVIDTTSPAGWPFWVDSDDEQITVGFAEYHCHCGGFAGSTVEADVAEAVDFIQALRTGQLVLAVSFRGEEYAGSYPLPPDEQPRNFATGANTSLKIRRWSE